MIAKDPLADVPQVVRELGKIDWCYVWREWKGHMLRVGYSNSAAEAIAARHCLLVSGRKREASSSDNNCERGSGSSDLGFGLFRRKDGFVWICFGAFVCERGS